jgi:hypothetical protein
MLYICEGNLRTNLVTKIPEHVTVKVFGIVNCDLLWDSVTTNNVLLEKNLMVTEVMLVMGFASTHFMKYSTATMAKVYLPYAWVSLPTMSMPHRCNGRDGVINCEGCAKALERCENF